MMELNMWTDNSPLSSDWGLDLLVDASSGPFGDLKLEGRHGGEDILGFQLQDAVEHVLNETPMKDEDILGMEWMESSDLGSFLGDLGDLGGSHDKLLPLEASLYDYTSTTAPEELIFLDQPLVKEEPSVQEQTLTLKELLQPVSSASKVLKGIVASGSSNHASQTVFDALLSAPNSPDQVAPVITLDTIDVTTAGEGDDGNSGSQPIHNVGLEFFNNDALDHNIVLDEVSFVGSCDTSSYDDGSEFISSPLSAQDIDSMLSQSMPSSPSSVSQNSIIESSPELYKVISTNSVESSSRFSPYSKSKTSKTAKVNRKRAPAQPVPEHVIVEQLNKKDRKKLQNKNAAIRYRMKKKEEAQGIKSEEQVLEEINEQLKTKVEDLQREIRYMKNLMEDVCKAKGLF